ncbi:MAG TPA: sigma-70 family RNA polymerase sigma factor [Planctomycetota bacterium]
MSPSPIDFESQLKRHGRALRALAAQLVSDANVADDVVQDVWLAALQRPPRHQGSLGGWLATALHNVVRIWRRKERRRAAHLQAFAGLAVPDCSAASREHAHGLLHAVEALEPVYRDAVWQRYFEDKPPRAIAAASGVPVATIKSRLQRGLVMLRERLASGDAEHGRDWRGALAVAFGLREGAATTGAVTVATGGVLMATWTKVVAVAAAAAFAVVLWWPGGAEPVPAGPGRSDAPVAAVRASPPSEQEAPAVVREPASSPEREAAAVGTASKPAFATIRGRCVDASGNAVGDCAVELLGWLGRAVRSEEWLLEHGAKPIELRAQPDAEGRFELRFEPPPFTFSLTIDGERWAPATRHWDELAPGAVEDLGDVVLEPGARVRGRAVHGAGVAVGEVSLTLRAADTGSKRSSEMTGQTGADGAFVFRKAVPLGVYRITASDGWSAVAPELRVDSAGTIDVRVVLARPDVPTITGTLVDDAERPIARQPVSALGERDRVVAGAWTRADGTFTLRATQADPAVAVRVRGGEVEAPGEPTAPVPWGSSGVRVVLRVPPRAVLTVFTGDTDGAPLSGCTVRVAPADSSRWHFGSPAPWLRTGEDGAVTARMRPGRYLVFAQFPSSRGWRAQVEPVDLDGGPRRIEIRFGTDAARCVRVVRADGSPVAGTNVQLCEPWSSAEPRQFEVRMPGEWFTSNTSGTVKVLVLDHGTTGADGALVLHGPRGRALTLRVLGPGHVVAEQEIRLDATGDLEVLVASGARVRGRIEPPEAMAELKRLAGVPRAGFPAADNRPRIGFCAGRTTLPGPTAKSGMPDLERFVIRDDGSFDVAGLPPGSWDVQVMYQVRSEWMTVSQRFPLGTRTLTEGAVCELVADLTPLLPGTIRARVLENGQPVANMSLGLQRAPDGTGGDSISPTHLVTTDGDGRFEITTRPGRYQLQRGNDDTIVAFPTIELTRGGVIEPTLEFAAGAVQIRLLTADGSPASGVAIHTDQPGLQRLRTKADGTVSANLPPGDHELRVLARRQQEPEVDVSSEAHRRGDLPAAPVWFPIGTATVVVGRTTTLECRLPPEWEK